MWNNVFLKKTVKVKAKDADEVKLTDISQRAGSSRKVLLEVANESGNSAVNQR